MTTYLLSTETTLRGYQGSPCIRRDARSEKSCSDHNETKGLVGSFIIVVKSEVMNDLLRMMLSKWSIYYARLEEPMRFSLVLLSTVIAPKEPSMIVSKR